LNHIGRVNASFITKVAIEDFFRAAEKDLRYRDNRPSGLARILPIQTAILNNACPAFTELTLHQDDDCDLWDDDLGGTLGLTDEQRVDDVVAKVVNGLPGFQKLQLGNWMIVATQR
jgi:hypothetical protein